MKAKEEFAINKEYLTFLCMSIVWYNLIGHSIVYNLVFVRFVLFFSAKEILNPI